MTKLSQAMDLIIQEIATGRYQVSENVHGKALLKIDLEDIMSEAIKNNEDQAEYIRNLEEELEQVNALLSKFEGQ